MKKRLDVLVTERGLENSREKARKLIMSGVVFVKGQREDKPGTLFPEDAEIEVRGQKLRYVSRGGLKLEKALAVFPVSPDGCVCMDVGASTGGFTDCMLQNGAVRVYAVDAGYGQLDYSLRNDPRVVCMEKTNIRYVTPEQVPEQIGFASVDVSFISLTKVLPALRELLADGASVVCLIKPQFEAGRGKVGKKGVVRDPAVHREVIGNVTRFAAAQGFALHGLTFSPIRGPEGNIEYLLYMTKDAGAGAPQPEPEELVSEEAARIAREETERRMAGLPDAAAVVEEAHRVLAGREEPS